MTQELSNVPEADDPKSTTKRDAKQEGPDSGVSSESLASNSTPHLEATSKEDRAEVPLLPAPSHNPTPGPSNPSMQTQETRPLAPPQNVRPSGVLIQAEIETLNLIHVPEPERKDTRCFQPASYDLRLGAEYVIPGGETQIVVSNCGLSGMVTIPPFATCIVSTYESVALPNNVVGRFNLRIQHALEGLIVQMGTQVEPGYKGPLIALLHNISDRAKTLKFRDYDTRPFTIEFSYTSAPAPDPEPRKKLRRSFGDFIPPNYARGGLNVVLDNIYRVQSENTRLSNELSGRNMMVFTGVALFLVLTTASIFIPWVLSKYTYDKNNLPLGTAESIAALKYGSNQAKNDEIIKEIMQELQKGSGVPMLTSPEQFYLARLTELKARRDLIKKIPAKAAELKLIEEEINEIIELLKK